MSEMDLDCDILIVEDSLTQALKLQRVLKQHGGRAVLARSGRDALAALAQQTPEIVLTETILPDMDGYELCRQIKAQESLQNVAVVLLNSFADPEGVLQVVHCGADQWIAKPYEDQALLALLETVRASQAGGGLPPADSPARLRGLLLSTYQAAAQRSAELREMTERLERLEEGKSEELTPKEPTPAQAPTLPKREGEEVGAGFITPSVLDSSSSLDSSSPRFGGSTRAAGEGGSLHILLAEDSPVNQQFARRTLEKAGHSVVVAGNGQEALARLAAEPFDVCLMDVEMPELDGFGATALIRRQEENTNARLPIIAMTAHDAPEDLARCLAAGMDAYLAKPLQIAAFNAALAALPAHAPPSEEAEALVVFDREDALARVDDDLPLLQEIAQLFLGEAPTLLAQIQEAAAQKDAALLERAAHTLKGAAASLSAPAVVAASLHLETMGREHDLAQAEGAVTVLEHALSALAPILTGLGNA